MRGCSSGISPLGVAIKNEMSPKTSIRIVLPLSRGHEFNPPQSILKFIY
jgi:hypothetical protein